MERTFYAAFAAVVLTFTHVTVYHKGQDSERKITQLQDKARDKVVSVKEVQNKEIEDVQDQDAKSSTANAQVAASAVDGVGLRRELDGLRKQLGVLRADAVSETTDRARLIAQATDATDSLGECGSQLAQVATDHDALSIQVTQWQERFASAPKP